MREYLGINDELTTRIEKLHAYGQFSLESIDLPPFVFEQFQVSVDPIDLVHIAIMFFDVRLDMVIINTMFITSNYG